MRRELAVVRRSVLLALILLAPIPGYAARGDGDVRSQAGGIRVPFIANLGQLDGRVAYYAPAYDGTFFLTQRGELVYSLPARPVDGPKGGVRAPSGPGWTVTETLVDGRPRPAAQDPTATAVSYFVGRDPAQWRRDAPTYGQIALGEVWPGVAVALRARGRGIEKVFTLSPGTPVDRVRLRVSGARGFSVNGDGALVASTGLGDVTFTPPVAYQEHDGVRRPVQVAYRSEGAEYGFTVGPYDPRRPLVIDPSLQSTYLGGSGEDAAAAIGVHSNGDVYVAGSTASTNFPGTTGGAQSSKSGGRDAFVARLNSALTSIVRVTYLGGSADDGANALAIHPSSGNVYVAGATASSDFPGTAGSAQAAKAGGTDAFVAQLSSDLGTLVRATYFGGSDTDVANAVVVHPSSGDVYIGGSTLASAACGSTAGFVVHYNAALTQLVQAGSTGAGQVNALAIHPTSGLPYVAGTVDALIADTAAATDRATRFLPCATHAFVKQLDANLLVTATKTYGSGAFGAHAGANALAIEPSSGDVFAAGAADPASIPGTVGGAHAACVELCAFVVRLNSALTTQIQATFLGDHDSAFHGASALAFHPSTGDLYVAGTTGDPAFPGTAGAIQDQLAGNPDGFVARLTTSLAAIFQATYLGGIGVDVATGLAIHPTSGDVYVTGSTRPLLFSDFPGTAGGAQQFNAGGTDAFVARLVFTLASVAPPAGPDLTINKAHPGHFTRGQVGQVYTITVSNVGTASTAGTVTVVDTLPAGFVATALSGTGWTCVLGTLTCTRGDALVNGQTYPAILLTVTVPSSAVSGINTANVSGGGDVNAGNNEVKDSTTVLSFFIDVSPTDPFGPFIDALFASGITGGCDTEGPRYCPDLPVTRGQMAIFILRGIHGPAFVPPPPVGLFLDAIIGDPFTPWVEQLFVEGITGGCNASPLLFCTFQNVTRAEMAVFLLRAIHGKLFVPPPAVGIFADVPVAHPFAIWIERLFNEGITTGCGVGPLIYCPDNEVSRAEMAVFLVRAFHLPFGP
jgi:uncharacterized repeat protein (TIGR01451 family)